MAQSTASSVVITRASRKRSVLRWIVLVLAVIILAAACVLVVFAVMAHFRESRTIAEAAPRHGKLIHTGDAMIFVQEQGPASGPNVVLVHGTGAWSELWRETIDALAQAGFHVVAVDLPPFGFSEKLKTGPQGYSVDKQARRILDVLSSLNIDHPAIVCHSVGCRPVVELALESPAQVGKLVLVDPALGFAPDQTKPHYDRNSPGLLSRAFFSMTALRNAVIATYGTNPGSIRPIFRSFVFNRDAVTDRRLKVLKEPLVLQGMTNAEADWLEHLALINDSVPGTDFSNFNRIAVPVGLIWGQKDTVTPPWQAEALRSLIPNSNLEVIENAGHIPYIENTAKFNGVLLKVLGERSGNRD